MKTLQGALIISWESGEYDVCIVQDQFGLLEVTKWNTRRIFPKMS